MHLWQLSGHQIQINRLKVLPFYDFFNDASPALMTRKIWCIPILPMRAVVLSGNTHAMLSPVNCPMLSSGPYSQHWDTGSTAQAGPELGMKWIVLQANPPHHLRSLFTLSVFLLGIVHNSVNISTDDCQAQLQSTSTSISSWKLRLPYSPFLQLPHPPAKVYFSAAAQLLVKIE